MCWNSFFFHSYRNLSSLEISKWGKLPQCDMRSHQFEFELTWYTCRNFFVKEERVVLDENRYLHENVNFEDKIISMSIKEKLASASVFFFYKDQLKRNSECWNWDHYKNKQDILFIGVETCKLINCLSPKVWVRGTWELLALVRLLNTSCSWSF